MGSSSDESRSDEIEEDDVDERGPPPAFNEPHETIYKARMSPLAKLKNELQSGSGMVAPGDSMQFSAGSVTVRGSGFESMYSLYSFVVYTDIREYSKASPFSRHGKWLWVFSFRYSDFLKFADVISSEYPALSLPKPPPKQRFGRFSDSTMRDRRQAFFEYFGVMAADIDVLRSPIVVNFLWPKKEFCLDQLIGEIIPRSPEDDETEIGEDIARVSWQSGLKLALEPVPVIRTGVEVYLELQEDKDVKAVGVVVGSSAVGRTVGSGAGAVVGTAVLPVVGTLCGAVVGGITGSISGSTVGKWIVKRRKDGRTGAPVLSNKDASGEDSSAAAAKGLPSTPFE